MTAVPFTLVDFLTRHGFWKRPFFLAQDILEAPDDGLLAAGVLYREVRNGFSKWAHFSCPRCQEGIHLPLAGIGKWDLHVDLLRRPTVQPSVWQTGSCGAHFFLRKGSLIWCAEGPTTNFWSSSQIDLTF